MVPAIVTPYDFPSARGNSIMVQRIESCWRDQGVTIRVSWLDQGDPAAILAALWYAIGRGAMLKIEAHFTPHQCRVPGKGG
jgi:hypothetical protein